MRSGTILTIAVNMTDGGRIMPDPLAQAPDAIPATGDPGDDTARRYRYQ
jgi:hypothetical protein